MFIIIGLENILLRWIIVGAWNIDFNGFLDVIYPNMLILQVKSC